MGTGNDLLGQVLVTATVGNYSKLIKENLFFSQLIIKKKKRWNPTPPMNVLNLKGNVRGDDFMHLFHLPNYIYLSVIGIIEHSTTLQSIWDIEFDFIWNYKEQVTTLESIICLNIFWRFE